MLKRKTQFVLWASVAALGALIPSVAYTDSAPAPMQSGYLRLEDAQSVISELKISPDGNGSATLTGTIPTACAGSIAIDNRGNGFAIKIIRGTFPDLQNCTQHPNGDYTSISDLANHSITASVGTLNVSYLNHVVADKALPNAGLVPAGEVIELKSAVQLAAEAKAEQQAKDDEKRASLEAAVTCVKSVDQADEILGQLRTSGIDVDDLIDQLNTKRDQMVARGDNAARDALVKKVQSAIDDGDTDKFSDLEDEMYGMMSDHPDWATNEKIGDQFGDLIYQMGKVRTQGDQTNEDGINAAAESFKRALDAENGFAMSDTPNSVKNRMAQAVAKGGELDVARMELDYAKFTQDRDQKRQGLYAYYGSDYRKFQNLQKSIYETLARKEKSMGCINSWGVRSEKRDNDSKLDDRCSAVEEQIQQLAQAPQLLEQKHQEEMQRAQQEAALRQAPQQQAMQQQPMYQQPQLIPAANQSMIPGLAGGAPGQLGNPYQPVNSILGGGSSTYGASGMPVSGAGAYQPMYYGANYMQASSGAGSYQPMIR